MNLVVASTYSCRVNIAEEKYKFTQLNRSMLTFAEVVPSRAELNFFMFRSSVVWLFVVDFDICCQFVSKN